MRSPLAAQPDVAADLRARSDPSPPPTRRTSYEKNGDAKKMAARQSRHLMRRGREVDGSPLQGNASRTGHRALLPYRGNPSCRNRLDPRHRKGWLLSVAVGQQDVVLALAREYAALHHLCDK